MVFGRCENHRLIIVRGKFPCPRYAVQHLQAFEQIGEKYQHKPETPKGQQAEFKEKETRCYEYASITSTSSGAWLPHHVGLVASTAKLFME